MRRAVRAASRVRLPSSTPFTSVRAYSSLDPSKLQVSLTDKPKSKLPKEELVFGKTFTDHMLRCPWSEGSGWHAPIIQPYGPLAIDPATAVLHYAIECFEGLKAYRGPKGEVRVFRADMNMQRMNNSMSRLQLPTFDGDALLDLIGKLIAVDKDWVPEGDGYSLYIRPTGISTEATLGVGPTRSAEIFVICSPVGPYYPEGFKPVTLYATNKYQRAWPGGTGNTKIGGNYSPTILPQAEANEKGFTQVLWLYGDHKQVTEVGTMNFFVLWVNEEGEKELVTAALDGTILPGVTRDSILTLARQWGDFKVTERTFTFDDVARSVEEGRMLEAFGAGTAAVVSPVRHIHHDGKGYDIPLDPADPNAGAGPVTTRAWKELLDIQYGRIESEWSMVIA